MRVSEKRPRRGRELLVAVLIETQVEPGALVFRVSSSRYPLHIFIAAGGAAHNSVGPALRLNICKTLLISSELYAEVADVDRLGMDAFVHDTDFSLLGYLCQVN